MSLPPERISVKRRRQDDPVETFFLEETRTNEKKKRFTEFLFRRIRADQDVPQPPIPSSKPSFNVDTKQQALSQYTSVPGIPLVRTTLPGEEVSDMLKMKAALKAHSSKESDQNAREKTYTKTSASQFNEKQPRSTSNTSTSKILQNARRFHLTREHAILGPSKEHAGIRKALAKAKAQLATFVENRPELLARNSRITSSSDPIDRIVEVTNGPASGIDPLRSLEISENLQVSSTKHTFSQPFIKVKKNAAKPGQTIHSHPDTWDLDSDQLASELAALAFEIDPTGNNEPDEIVVTSKPMVSELPDIEMEGDYVYETYIRLPHSESQIVEKGIASNIGVLVISAEDEELWETFAESDDDTEWDEEDADSNAEDNPSNDYPEDEVSSGDEFGYGAYDHRKNASDDEEYDFERDD